MVSNTIKEFSNSYKELYEEWKYVIKESEDGITIQRRENVDGEWINISSIEIPIEFAEMISNAILDGIKIGEFKEGCC